MAVDVGGTFTDVCVLDERTGALTVSKVPSTPDTISGVLAGAREAGVSLAETSLFIHGTTLATNALITRKHPRAGMVTTRGFRDILEIRRGTRDDLWDSYKEIAPPHIRRRDRLVVGERIDAAGEVVEPLDEDDARAVAAVFRKRGIENIAVCFVNSFVNPANEQRMKEILAEELPDARVSTSSDVLPEIFEHERFSTTVANAILAPVVGPYCEQLSRELREGGYGGEMLLMHSGGGVMTPRAATRFAARLAASGIAAGAIATRELARLCGYENAIGLDVGGTSTDVSLVYEGETHTAEEWYVEYGYPIRFPSIEVLTVGAGGGSLAWIDDAGSLRNGPQSAGSQPGPACYQRGGTEPTNSDANLLLGRLGSELIGGAMALDEGLAEEAIRRHIAEPLEMPVLEAARAIVEVANANMADAVRLVTIRRGYDPRDFALVVFGGAGPLHGGAVARDLGIPTVLVPLNPGVTSALGCLMVDVRHDVSQMHFAQVAEAELGEIEAAFAALEEEARELLTLDGVPAADMHFQRQIDMRYVGQWRSLSVAVEPGLGSLAEAEQRFHEKHGQEHNYRRDDAPVEIYRLGITAVGVTPRPEIARHQAAPSRPEPIGTRAVVWDDAGAVETPLYWRPELAAGAVIEGPAVIHQLDSTVLVEPGMEAEVDPWLNLRLTI
ncbi:MAG TPA: hydantoinase/oxoprolinase family protein [Solirubrobacterales bacterium]